MEDKSDNLSAGYSVRHMPSWLGKGDNRGRKDKDQQPHRVPGDRSTLYDGHWLEPKIFQESSSGTCRYSDQRGDTEGPEVPPSAERGNQDPRHPQHSSTQLLVYGHPTFDASYPSDRAFALAIEKHTC
ncbi:hypothetical protein NDA11_006624 [Ustilago hordei]|nr:hypothetical protein NDA11_006624 [Ustilago hordei]KAJ1587310.1 hypothetical protein NDA15_004293 [Ustilago hordei]KAJ1602239.1 hypothetical protein NDA14_003309 [Ustilago hordei]UTT97005.1 hypothetical protein NDA17_006273 [Ustilago hordei]